MKKIIFSISFLVSAMISYSICAQDHTGLKEIYDEERDETYKVGEYAETSVLAQEPGFELIGNQEIIEQLKLDESEKIEELSAHLQGVDVVIAIGTWCDDSRTHVPDILNLLSAAGYDQENITIYAFDREKKGLNGEEKTYDIHYVPTVVFYREGEEIGRFVEYPENTVLDDFINILSE